MPRIKGLGKGVTDRLIIRVDKDTATYYRKKSSENGMSLSEYLRQTLVQGVIAENVQEIEWKLKQTVKDIKSNLPSENSLPDEVILSLFTSEALLTAIVEARDIQQLYEAQNSMRLANTRFQ